MSILHIISILIILWIISLIVDYMFQLPFKVYDAVQWSWLEIRFYQEPQNSNYRIGCNTLEVGWQNPIFMFQILYWSIEIELIFYS